MHQENKYFWLLFFIFGVTSVIVQALFAPLIAIHFYEPDFVLVVVLLISKRFGGIKGSTAGFLLGLLQDAVTGLPLGISALPKSAVGYLGGKFHGHAIKSLSLDLWFIVFILIHEIIFYALFQFKSEFSFHYFFLNRALPNTLYTTVILIITALFTEKYFSE